MTIRCLVMAFWLLWPSPLTFWAWSVVAYGRSRDQPPPPTLKVLWLLVVELWVLTSPIGYHWQCICSYCVCAVSRDLCVGGEFSPHIWNFWPRFAYSLYNLYSSTIKTNWVMREVSVWPCVKDDIVSAHVQNHVSFERCRKSFTTIVLGTHDFLLMASNLRNLTAFRVIFSHIFTAHAQKQFFMNLWWKLWDHHEIC